MQISLSFRLGKKQALVVSNFVPIAPAFLDALSLSLSVKGGKSLLDGNLMPSSY